tara:strand:- start:181 stop:786 length:606 start_codon:yes stop_codon:yes gene_type:complete
MKVYTKTGDKGTSSLYDGSRTSKDSIIFDTIGELDELTSRIGFLISLLTEKEENIVPILRKTQKIIQDINTIIATVKTENKVLPEITEEYITELEQYIDSFESKNSKLTKFILPGVTMMDAQAQLCRTQTRKSERFLWYLHNSGEDMSVFIGKKEENVSLDIINIDMNIMKYMNRLSDFFFVLGRFLCKNQGFNDAFASDY